MLRIHRVHHGHGLGKRHVDGGAFGDSGVEVAGHMPLQAAGLGAQAATLASVLVYIARFFFDLGVKLTGLAVHLNDF